MGKWAARIVCLALAAALSAPSASFAFAQERAASASDEVPAAVGAEGGPAAAGTGGTQGADAGGEDQGRLVRVAFPQAEGLSMVDEKGRRSGVFYDWLVEIAKYTGWRYEFVEGGVDELVKQTMTGGVDLMGGMFYREQLDESLDYSVFSMGSNRSLVIGSSDDESVVGFDLRSLDGKTIGAYANATEKIRRLENFLEFNGLDCTVLRLDLASYESCLDDGTADLMLGSDVEMRDGCKVVAEFDGEPHYLAVPEGSDLMAGVDEAMRQIYAADPNFSRSLYNRYFPDDYASPIAFSEADRAYVAQAGEVRVAVTAGQYPLYYERDGSYQGIAKDVLDRIAERTGLSFRFVRAGNYQEALDLVAAGEADVAGCFMDDEQAAGERGLVLTKGYATLGEVVFRSKFSAQSSGGPVVAQLEGRAAPKEQEGSEVVWLPTYADCLEAVNTGRADLTSMPASFAECLFTERSYGNVAPATADHSETSFSLALPRPVDSGLYSVLSKAVNSFSDEELEALYSRNAVALGNRSATVESFVSDNPLLVVVLSLVFFLLVGTIAIIVTGSKVRSRMMALKLEKAEETGQAKADFLSRMSHEIRTPMNAIIGLSNVASLSGEATPAIRSDLERINASAQFLLSLVNDILDMSKIQNDKMHIEVAPLRLASLASRLESMFGIQAQERDISLKVVCETDAVVVADDVRLQQVLANLLSNAFKFTDAGGTISLSIEETGCGGDGLEPTYRFSVADDGAGIRPEDLERIFDSFEQAAENHRNAQGTGLGLAISSNLVRLMGGKLEVESQVGAGSEFHFALQLPSGRPEDLDAQGVDDPAPRSLAGTRALLAEDNDLNAEIAAALLDR
ncbi:MAG: ATP-binding protein, partial [Gordonibacter urolithinfaciens]